MNMYEIIEAKASGRELTSEQIRFTVKGFTDAEIPDYQMSAWLMAVLWRGMSARETSDLTRAMTESGEVVDLSGINGIVSDKHSTGGVGDKTSMALVPLVAACGGKVAKMSGRGLGHTGGTIDKLESIPGFKVELPIDQFIAQVNRIGCAIIGASKNVAPADKKMYALRDVTATVGSIPLMASSIMAKKLASGSDAIVLDVKCGSGAFMKSVDQARILAKAMMSIGIANGKKMAAFITNMDVPLGTAIGNGLEVVEVIETLKGQGPADLTHECLEIGSYLLSLSGFGTPENCYIQAEAALSDGRALKKFAEMIEAQGGDSSVIEDYSILLGNPASIEVRALRDGYITKMDTEKIGMCSVSLGAGRSKITDPLDYHAGITILHKTGDQVKTGDTLAILYAANPDLLEPATDNYLKTLTFGDKMVASEKLVFDILR
ncbi:MAG: thymidine phosphorylase [Bifidobacteriaceae bacterium]|jgi:pyrimidine-nucleoside phosphorylase|nr:thymidine phosphorylase [Bifidobacteriaceae bacterium]